MELGVCVTMKELGRVVRLGTDTDGLTLDGLFGPGK